MTVQLSRGTYLMAARRFLTETRGCKPPQRWFCAFRLFVSSHLLWSRRGSPPCAPRPRAEPGPSGPGRSSWCRGPPGRGRCRAAAWSLLGWSRTSGRSPRCSRWSHSSSSGRWRSETGDLKEEEEAWSWKVSFSWNKILKKNASGFTNNSKNVEFQRLISCFYFSVHLFAIYICRLCCRSRSCI